MEHAHCATRVLRLVYLLFASFKNFYVFTGIQTQDFQFGKERESDELNHPTKETQSGCFVQYQWVRLTNIGLHVCSSHMGPCKAGYRLSNMFCGTATAAATNMIFTSLGEKCFAQTAAAAGPNHHLNAAVQAKRRDFSHSVSFSKFDQKLRKKIKITQCKFLTRHQLCFLESFSVAWLKDPHLKFSVVVRLLPIRISDQVLIRNFQPLCN